MPQRRLEHCFPGENFARHKRSAICIALHAFTSAAQTHASAMLTLEGRLLVISPHLDDAVFACGRLIASHPSCVVVTVFAGLPANTVTTTQLG